MFQRKKATNEDRVNQSGDCGSEREWDVLCGGNRGGHGLDEGGFHRAGRPRAGSCEPGEAAADRRDGPACGVAFRARPSSEGC